MENSMSEHKKNIKNTTKYRLLCIITAGLCMLGGCSFNDKANDETVSPDPIENEMSNREYLSSMLKSWEIFNKAAENADGDPEREPLRSAIIEAVASEAANKNIEITLSCRADQINEYKRMAGEFKWIYAADDQYHIEIKIVSDDSSKNADVFFFSDNSLNELVSEGKVAKVNDKLRYFTAHMASADSIRACTFREKQYGFPMSSSKGDIMVYDKRFYSDDEIYELEKMIEKADSSSKSVFYPISDPYFSAGIFLAAGCEPVFDGKTQVIGYNTDEGLSASHTICSLAKYQGKGLLCSGDIETLQSSFKSGKICAAIITGDNADYICSALGEENTGIAPLPSVMINNEPVAINSFSGFEIAGINPRSKYPFTAQLFAYYISRPRSQIGMYYALGTIPSVDVSEYLAIAEDPLFEAVNTQAENSHIRPETISGDFIKKIEKSGLLTKLLEMKEKPDDNRIKSLLSELN